MNSNTYELKGSGIIEGSSQSFSTAKLIVDNQTLRLKFSIEKDFIFLPEDIISVQPVVGLTVLESGVKIKHCISGYDNNLIFRASEEPQTIINKINQTGFLENIYFRVTEDVFKKVRKEQKVYADSVFKTLFVYWVVGLLNLTFFADTIRWNLNGRTHFGLFMMIGCVLTFFVTILAFFSRKISTLILKEGVRLGDVKKDLCLSLLYCVLLFLFITVINISRQRNL